MCGSIFYSEAIRNTELEGRAEFLSPVAHMTSNHATWYPLKAVETSP